MNLSISHLQRAGGHRAPSVVHGRRRLVGDLRDGHEPHVDPSAGPPHLGPRFARLGDLLSTLLLTIAGLSLVHLVIELNWFQPHGGIPTLLGLASVALLVVTAAVWCAWQWRLATSAPRGLRRGPLSHAVAWFIPFGNLWLPYEDVSGLWYAYTPRGTEPGGPVPSLIQAWWASWVLTLMVGGVGLNLLSEVPSLDDVLGTARAAVPAAAACVSALLAHLVVRRLSWRALVHHADRVADQPA